MNETFAQRHPFVVLVKDKKGNAVEDSRFTNEKLAIRTASERRGWVQGPHVAMTDEQCREEAQRIEREKERPHYVDADKIREKFNK